MKRQRFVLFCFISISIATLQAPSVLCQTENDTIDYYEKLILEGWNASLKYEAPEDLSEFRPENETEIVDYGTFDFIVVGSGSTGSVVASRLSEVLDWKVLLIEAGDFGNDYTSVTRMAYKAYMATSTYNWGYYSVPQTTACLGMKEQRCAHPRGKGVGGTALINAVLYVRGNSYDFDLWCQMGNPGWCYEDVMPYFLVQEDFQPTDPEAPIDWEYHSQGGLLRVEYMMPRHEQAKVFFTANEELGYNLTDVNNGYAQIGVSPFPLNTNVGKRWDSGTAFVKPFLYRTNFTVTTNSFATKILINDDKEAEGVLFTNNGVLYRANASKEVIVCGGTINSPVLLMLSGIGPKEHLEDVGIEVIQDLQGVGSNFSDHLQVYGLTFSSNLTETFQSQSLRDDIKDFLRGVGPLAQPLPSQAVGYYATSLAEIEGYPDLELSFQESNATNDALSNFQRWNPSISDAMSGNTSYNSFSIYVTPLHTKSVGTIRLNSSDPYALPLIDPNCLSDAEGHDIELAYQGIQLALNLSKTRAFQGIDAQLSMQPIEECADYEFMSKDYWYCAIRYITAHNNHPVATCKMGPDPSKGDVVDAELKVHGIKKLRVADASVIPLSTSSHINSMCYMIGEKLVAMIRDEYGKNDTTTSWRGGNGI